MLLYETSTPTSPAPERTHVSEALVIACAAVALIVCSSHACVRSQNSSSPSPQAGSVVALGSCAGGGNRCTMRFRQQIRSASEA